MQAITQFFHIILMQPLVNLLILGYEYIPGHDVGVSIIVLTLLIRLILLPSFHKSLKAQKQINDIQPKLNALKEQHKDDKEAQAKAMMALYKEHSINPFGSCLPLLIQLPFLLALYRVFYYVLRGTDLKNYLYSWVHNPVTLNPYFLHWINLSQPSLWLGIVAGIAQYLQSKAMLPKIKSNDPTTQALQMQTLYILPILTVVISLRLPAGLPLYWIISTLFAAGQQYYIMRNNNSKVEVLN